MNVSYPFIQPTPTSQGLTRKRDIIIDLCNEEGLAEIRWIISKAMPQKLVGPTFKADTNEVAFEQMDLIAETLNVEYNP